jgi:hypothetical protein
LNDFLTRVGDSALVTSLCTVLALLFLASASLPNIVSMPGNGELVVTVTLENDTSGSGSRAATGVKVSFAFSCSSIRASGILFDTCCESVFDTSGVRPGSVTLLASVDSSVTRSAALGTVMTRDSWKLVSDTCCASMFDTSGASRGGEVGATCDSALCGSDAPLECCTVLSGAVLATTVLAGARCAVLAGM